MRLSRLFRHIRPWPPEQVTTIAPGEVDPREAGLRREDVEAIWRAVVHLYQGGLHPAVALCLRRRGLVVLDRAIGHARGNAPDDPPDAERVLATPNTLFNLFSASKAVTAMMIHLLDERGLVHLDDPVAEFIPEFGRHGKGWITLRHLLTHRAGIPAMPPHEDPLRLLAEPDRLFALLCECTPIKPFGRHLGYHAVTGGAILGEVVRRVTGKDLRALLHESVLAPLGMQHFNYGVRPEEVHLVARNAATGPTAPPPYSWMLRRALGVDLARAVEISNHPAFLTAVVPSGNIIGTANEASRFFQLLLNDGCLDGVRIFERRTVRRAIAEQTYLEVDSIMALPVRYGMGFMLGRRHLSPFGPDTPHAFGHLGFTATVVYADRERDISVALLTSGKPFITPGQLRWLAVLETIARRCKQAR
ncbi:MAG: serine hydrolase domain-containing protein [Myxococcales bacterium]|nr:beta-lactamase family protein [Myxococcota bacterium]MDW8283031.1 serine hydrolase domain-containing protein [Myxococcales bacterium]